jgi:hypothetical protein
MGTKVMNKRTGGPMPKIYKTTKGNFTARELAKIGGFELGIQKALGDKAECVGYSEIDKYANSIYRANFKGENNERYYRNRYG